MHDDIEEHDNRLPNWWLATLFGSIVFALVYWTYYQTLAVGPTNLADLRADEASLATMRERNAPAVTNESLLAASADSATVERGKAVFMVNCVACHGPHGEGIVGPNLTDSAWLHGDTPKEIHTVITNGVLEKGMLAWGNVLGAAKVQDVTAFVLSIKGKNLPGKAPQGISKEGAKTEGL